MIKTEQFDIPDIVPGFATDTFITADGGRLAITFIKHASLLLTFNGKNIYLDPVSKFADYTKLPKADVILVTHEHWDHLDAKAIGDISTEHTILITNANSATILGKGTIMHNGDVLNPTDWLQVEAVPAYNTTPDHTEFHPKGRDNGYVLTLGGNRIYFSGDTEDIPEMKNLKNIDIAFISVNQPYTMTLAQAVHAALMINPSILYPYHYTDTEIQYLPDMVSDESKMEVRIRELQ